MLLIIACSKSGNEQITPNVPTGKMIKELAVNGITREYIIYVPENYNVTTAFPLLLSFHGLTSNMEFNYSYTNFDEQADKAYPWLLQFLPTGLKGVAFAALAAAIVSSLASMLNSTSTIFTMDIYKQYINKKTATKYYDM